MRPNPGMKHQIRTIAAMAAMMTANAAPAPSFLLGVSFMVSHKRSPGYRGEPGRGWANCAGVHGLLSSPLPRLGICPVHLSERGACWFASTIKRWPEQAGYVARLASREASF